MDQQLYKEVTIMFINGGMSANSPFARATSASSRVSSGRPSPLQAGGAAMNRNRDSATISTEGKRTQRNNAIQNLMERKEEIKKTKEEYLVQAFEKGISSEEQDAKIKTYDEQMDAIDEQIDELKKPILELANLEEKENTEAAKKPKTEEEIEQGKLSELVEGATSMERAEKLNAVQKKLEGEANVKNGVAENDTIKEDMLLEERISKAQASYGMTRAEAERNPKSGVARSLLREIEAAEEMRDNAQVGIDQKLDTADILEQKQLNVIDTIRKEIDEKDEKDEDAQKVESSKNKEQEVSASENNEQAQRMESNENNVNL